MRVRIYQAGKQKAERKVDVTVDLAKERVAFGGTAECQVKIPGVEELVAELKLEGAKIVLRNLSEGASVVAESREVEPGEETTIAKDVLLAFDGFEVVCDIDEEAFARLQKEAPAEGEMVDSLDLAVKDVLKSVYNALGVPEDRPTLVVYDKENQVAKRLEIGNDDTEITIGRHPTNRLVLYHATVSKEHARVVRDALGFAIKDAGSRNGVEVNGQKVSGTHRLKSGDRIQIGCFTLAYFDPQVIVKDLKGSESVAGDGKARKSGGGAAGRVVVGNPEVGASEDTIAPEGLTGAVAPLAKDQKAGAAGAADAAKAAGKDGGDGKAGAAVAKKKAASGGGGPGFVIYLLVALGVLLLLGAVGAIVYVLTSG